MKKKINIICLLLHSYYIEVALEIYSLRSASKSQRIPRVSAISM
jgi:hypothetical protein